MASNSCSRRVVVSLRCGLLLIVGVAALPARAVDNAPAAFFHGWNLNGPAATIDGHPWDGQNTKNYVCTDKAFDTPNINLLPSTDAERSKMICSSRSGGNRELTAVPSGR